MKWMKERRGLDHSFTALEAKFIRLPLGLFIPRLRERSVWLAGQLLRPPHPFPYSRCNRFAREGECMNSSRSLSFFFASFFFLCGGCGFCAKLLRAYRTVPLVQAMGIEWRGGPPPASRYEQPFRSYDDQGETFEREAAGAETHSQRLLLEDSPIRVARAPAGEVSFWYPQRGGDHEFRF